MPDVEELDSGDPRELVVENALRKARDRARPGELVLGADTAVQEDLHVRAENEIPFHSARFAQRVLDDDLARVAVGDLVDVGGLDTEVDPELLQDPLPLRRAGSEYQHRL